jgi:hypothetical protein
MSLRVEDHGVKVESTSGEQEVEILERFANRKLLLCRSFSDDAFNAA